MAVLDEDGHEMPDGQAGEIGVQGPSVMLGYFKQPDLTASTLRDGWLRTGDMAVRDGDGYFTIVDRKKDMIVSGGFNVFPREIEDVLSAHPSVSAVAVIGVPDDKWGEAVKALVVARPGAVVDGDELVALVRDKKGPVYAPKSVDVVDSASAHRGGKGRQEDAPGPLLGRARPPRPLSGEPRRRQARLGSGVTCLGGRVKALLLRSAPGRRCWSRWSARSEARTNDLDQPEGRCMLAMGRADGAWGRPALPGCSTNAVSSATTSLIGCPPRGGSAVASMFEGRPARMLAGTPVAGADRGMTRDVEVGDADRRSDRVSQSGIA